MLHQLTRLQRMTLHLTVVAAIVITVAVSSASAGSIAPPVIQVGAAGGTPILTVGTVNGSSCTTGPTGGCQSSTATAFYDGFYAMVSGSASTTGGTGTANTYGTASVTFFFRVVGSAPDVTAVPLIFTGRDSTSASGPDAEATGYFQTPGGQIDSCSATGLAVGHCGTLPPTNSGSLRYNAQPLVPYDVGLIASGSATLVTGSWSAFVDPEVEIDPNFQYANDFTLEFSPASAPEPASLALLGSALLSVAGWRRFQKR